VPVTIPDPIEAARVEAAYIQKNPKQFIEGRVDRVLLDAPFLDRASLLEGVEAFHKERMEKAPSATTYPEAQPWVEHIRTRNRELQALTGMSDVQLAICRSLNDFMTFRGSASVRLNLVEKCRIVYLPHSDQGEFHIKNVDDPITFWKPSTHKPTEPPQVTGLTWDGVGSGMHIDDEPDEIFPLLCREMCRIYCDDVPGAVEFLTRYSQFWGGQNIVLYDNKKRSVAIEKSSHNYIEVFTPGANGGSHCSGMACRDAQSPQRQYQTEKRRQYLEKYNLPDDGPDMVFWDACDRAEQMLGDLMAKPNPSIDEILNLFTTPWPEGLNKTGAKFHPKQAMGEYTLETRAEFFDQKKYIRWQRDEAGLYPDQPEVFQF
jgi:hypothetical protein